MNFRLMLLRIQIPNWMTMMVISTTTRSMLNLYPCLRVVTSICACGVNLQMYWRELHVHPYLWISCILPKCRFQLHIWNNHYTKLMMLYLVDDHTLMRMYIDDFESAQ